MIKKILDNYFESLSTQHNWQHCFQSDIKELFENLIRLEKINLPYTTNYLSEIFKNILKGEEDDFHKWSFILGDKTKKDYKIEINKEKMSIIFVTGIFPGLGHGGGLRILDMIYELAKKGHEVTLYSSTSQLEGEDKAKDILEKCCTNFHLVPPEKFTLDNLNEYFEENDYNFDIGYFVWPWTINLFPQNRSRIKKMAFEYIECTTRRLFLDFVNANEKMSPEKLKSLCLDFLQHLYCEKEAAKKADLLITVTEKDSHFINKIIPGTKSHVVSTGVSEVEFSTKSNSSDQIPVSSCFIGNYFHYPNLDALIWYLDNIHQTIVNEVPNYTFSVVGRGDPVKIAELKKKYSRFENSIRWVGAVDSVSVELSKYTICLCPLISGAGLRGKVIQYSSLPKATVSTSIGVCGMPFEDNDSIMVADEPQDFAQKTIQLLTNDKLRNLIQERAHQTTKDHYSWDTHISRLEELFRKESK